ncbi:hypothetical protein PSD17_19940 [Pseudonocardia sp. D17]|nr:hypothetical protein PSD17_19940 [Pseudonocardia sp. D17]
MVSECDQPIRSAITVAGIRGYSASNARTRGSTASTSDPRGGRWYFGGRSELNAERTVFREICSRRAISLIDKPSARCNRRISAQSSTLITLLTISEGGHFSAVDTCAVFTRRRQGATRGAMLSFWVFC